MERSIIKTKDGSATIYLPEIDETYHSLHGAVQEARHVFIEQGLRFLINHQETEEVRIFEMGLGTGLNAVLSCMEHVPVKYIGVEAFPVPFEMVDEIDYPAILGRETQGIFERLHTVPWDEYQQITDTFCIQKMERKIEQLSVDFKVDLIYYDAFGPRAQSSMWEMDVLSKMAEMLNDGGVLVTYCAQGQFRRNLKALGFEVEALPGPPGKREMTRAIFRQGIAPQQ